MHPIGFWEVYGLSATNSSIAAEARSRSGPYLTAVFIHMHCQDRCEPIPFELNIFRALISPAFGSALRAQDTPSHLRRCRSFIHREVELACYDLTQPRAIDVGGHRHRLFNFDTAVDTASWLHCGTVTGFDLGKNSVLYRSRVPPRGATGAAF
jgi:hypothetical protein